MRQFKQPLAFIDGEPVCPKWEQIGDQRRVVRIANPLDPDAVKLFLERFCQNRSKSVSLQTL